jgi:glycosyltransferase involved in cell wall biosynthesis
MGNTKPIVQGEGIRVPDQRLGMAREEFAGHEVEETDQRPIIGKRKPVSHEETTIVIPTLNEAGAIGKILVDLKREGFANILVVDGYSKDGTPEIAKDNGAVVVMQHGPGKAGALQTAIEMVETPYMVVMDGDDTYSASDIDNLLEYAGDYDEVIGARTEGRENISRVNRLGNGIISRVFKLLFGTPVTDILSGMYVLRTEKVREINLTSAAFDVEVEIASAMATAGNITQVPIGYGKRIGKQKLKRTQGGRILSTLFWMAYYYNPVFLFGGVVGLVTIPAAGIMLWVFFEGIFFGVWHSSYALLGLGLLLIATQAAAVALTALLLKRSERRLTNLFRESKTRNRLRID